MAKKNAPRAAGSSGRAKDRRGSRETLTNGDSLALPGLQAEKVEAKPRVYGPTWMSPYLTAWEARFGNKPVSGVIGRTLERRHKELGVEVVLPALIAYLAETEEKYVSLWKFADTITYWIGMAGASQKPEERWTPTWEE